MLLQAYTHMTYKPDKHHRHSIRLKEYDYSQAGAYFLAICTQNRECLFGDIIDGEIRLNEYGEIVAAEWIQTQIIRQNIQIDEYVVMPNHFHGIIILNDPVGARRCLARSEMAARSEMPTRSEMATNAKQTNGQTRATHRVAPTVQSGTIGSIIGQFKSIVTKQINQIRNTTGHPVWQRNYYEHVIRSEESLHKIREYIINNPLKWDDDENNLGDIIHRRGERFFAPADTK